MVGSPYEVFPHFVKYIVYKNIPPCPIASKDDRAILPPFIRNGNNYITKP